MKINSFRGDLTVISARKKTTGVQVLTNMLTLLRDQQCVAHEQHLEWIVIMLIVITIALGVFQIASLLGVISLKHTGSATPGKVMAYAVQSIGAMLGSPHRAQSHVFSDSFHDDY